MTIVPLILISSSQTKAMTPGSSTGRGCFQDAGLPPGRGSKVRARGGRNARPRVGVRAPGGGGGALPWLTGGVRLQVPAAPGRGSSSSSGRPASWLQGRARRAPRLADILLSTRRSGHFLDTGYLESINMEEQRWFQQTLTLMYCSFVARVTALLIF